MALIKFVRDAAHIRINECSEETGTQTEELQDHITSSKESQKWAAKAEFMLSLLGYIVGLGSLWRFPYLCMINGGGAFLIPFITCIFFIAFPLFFIEIALGQFTARSIIHCWEACPIFKGLGYGMVIANGLCCIYYVMIVTWTLYYLGNSFINPLPWSSCDNVWNSERCLSDDRLRTSNSSFHKSNGSSSEEEYWQFNVLDISSGIEHFGEIKVDIVMCLLVAWFIIFLCLIKGVKSMGKVWTEAAIQVFYSTCICWGPLISMASYNNFKSNCLRDSIILLTLGEGTSVFGGFVVFSVLGVMARSSGVAIDEVVRSGPGLVYIAYPEAISKLPLPNLWAVMFFLMVLTIGLDTQFGTVEPIIAVFSESFVNFRKRRMMFTAVIISICFVCGIPLCFQGGMYLFQLLDWYVAAFCIPIFGLIECLVFGWIYGAGNFSRDIKMMTGVSIPLPIRIMWCFITPILLVVLFIVIVLAYRPPNYGDYTYPAVANVFGMIFAMIPIVPIPVLAFMEVRKAGGCTLKEENFLWYLFTLYEIQRLLKYQAKLSYVRRAFRLQKTSQ